MAGVLFLLKMVPFPLNKWDKIRAFNILKQISQNYDVYLGAFVDDPLDWPYIKELDKYCIETCIVEKPNVLLNPLRILKSLITGKNYEHEIYYDLHLKQWVDSLIDTNAVDRILVNSPVMAQYFFSIKNLKSLKIIDFVDMDSQKILRRGSRKIWPISQIYKFRAKKLQSFETKIANFGDVNIFASKSEVQFFKGFAKTAANPIISLKNGVDTSYYNPYLRYPNPYHGNNKIIIFSGVMDDLFNVEAVKWFVKNVLPKVAKIISSVQFYIIGVKPNKIVYRLTNNQNVVVTGQVPDTRPYLQHADLVVAPLRTPIGIQNNVLETLAMNVPIIASERAINGMNIGGIKISLNLEKNLWINKVCQLLNLSQDHRDKINTREYIHSQYSWKDCLRPLEEVLSLKGKD